MKLRLMELRSYSRTEICSIILPIITRYQHVIIKILFFFFHVCSF